MEKASVVSFDIFDTLLLRPYLKPSDLFVHLEKLENKKGFAAARIEAEKVARKSSRHEEITFDEIYSQISPEYKDLQQIEADFEAKVLFPRDEVVELFKLAVKLKKHVIITSDMYLPKELIRKILKKNGITGYKNLFLSSELLLTKHSGNLFYHVCRELSVSPETILHIGDNSHSDKSVPEKIGIKSVLIPKLTDVLFEKEPRYNAYYKNDPNLAKSIIVSMLARCSEGAGYWYKLGWKYAAPAILAYTQWLDFRVQEDGIKHLLFVARDGYMLQKVFNKIKTSNCASTYMFAPRLVNREDENGLAEYKKYLEELKLPKKNIAMVDSITYNFSSQLLLRKAFQKSMKAYYWVVGKGREKDIPDVSEYCEFRENKFAFMKEWGLMELFMTAPHCPVAGFKNGKPILCKVNPDEKRRIEVYKSMEKGIEDLTDLISKLFGKYNLFIMEKDIRQLVDMLPASPSKEDIKYLSTLTHASDNFNKKYDPLMRSWFNAKIKFKIGSVSVFKIVSRGNKRKYYLFGIQLFTRKIKK